MRSGGGGVWDDEDEGRDDGRLSPPPDIPIFTGDEALFILIWNTWSNCWLIILVLDVLLVVDDVTTVDGDVEPVVWLLLITSAADDGREVFNVLLIMKQQQLLLNIQHQPTTRYYD